MEKYRIAWQATDDNRLQSMLLVCWIPKATNPHSEYVIINDFPLQTLLHACAEMLRYTHFVLFFVDCLLFPLSVSLHSCPILIFMLIPLLSEGRAVEAWQTLSLILLTWRIWWAANNASRWQVGFNPYPANVENMVSS